jgi:hypothetical protein
MLTNLIPMYLDLFWWMREALAKLGAGVLIALLVIGPSPASAQVEGALGGIKTVVTKGVEEEDIGQSFLGLVVKQALSASGRHILALPFTYDTESESEGMGVRYYFDAIPGNGLVPGIGISGWRLDPDNIELLETNTTFIGPEILLDFDIPIDGQSLPATAIIGYYSRVAGDAGVGMLRFGAQLSPDLFGSSE